MMKARKVLGYLAAVACVGALGVAQSALQAASQNQNVQAPRFEVDPMWPKPLPNHWILGSAIGVGVDSQDHVFIIHRGDSTLNQRTEVGADANPPRAECCRSAPPILEFDPEGNLVNSWGGAGEGYEWPLSNHGLTARRQGQRLDRRQWPHGLAHPQVHARRQVPDALSARRASAVNSTSTTSFGQVAKIAFDDEGQRGLRGRRLRATSASPWST